MLRHLRTIDSCRTGTCTIRCRCAKQIILAIACPLTIAVAGVAVPHSGGGPGGTGLAARQPGQGYPGERQGGRHGGTRFQDSRGGGAPVEVRLCFSSCLVECFFCCCPFVFGVATVMHLLRYYREGVRVLLF